jgi:hypothetical protein
MVHLESPSADGDEKMVNNDPMIEGGAGTREFAVMRLKPKC